MARHLSAGSPLALTLQLTQCSRDQTTLHPSRSSLTGFLQHRSAQVSCLCKVLCDCGFSPDARNNSPGRTLRTCRYLLVQSRDLSSCVQLS